MYSKIELLKNYKRETHLNGLFNDFPVSKISPAHLSKMYSPLWDKEWAEDDEELYVPITHILDAYYCLPERIDMSFTYLWKAINSIYSYLAIKKSTNQNLTEKDKIDLFLSELSSKLNDDFIYKSNQYTILQIITEFISLTPKKTMRFIANYVLKGMAIDIKANISSKYNSSQYKTFRTQFKDLFDIIEKTYGKAYMDNCNPTIKPNSSNSNLGIVEKDKARRITDSLAGKFQELLINRTITVTDDTHSLSFTYDLTDDFKYLDFIFRIFLYAIRNSSVHGNKASRFNSDFANEASIKSSEYVFLLGHMFLSFLMYLNNQLDINDLALNIENTSLFQQC